jgi:hypothetical protein
MDFYDYIDWLMALGYTYADAYNLAIDYFRGAL